jgi:hypothetical protein
MGALRIDYDGLIAVAIHDDHLGGAAEQVSLIFPDPAAHSLDPHAPRIEINDANIVDWSATSVAPQPNTSPLTFPLTGWDVTMLPDGLPPTGRVVFPPTRPDPADPSGIRLWDTPIRLLDLNAICGDEHLKDAYFDPAGSSTFPADLMGRFVVDSGIFHTGSLPNGTFEVWRFVLAGTEVHRQDSAAGFTSVSFPKEFARFVFTRLNDAHTQAMLTLKCPPASAVSICLKHTCLGSCARHKGKHLAIYYDMVQNAKRRPDPQFRFTDASYCPAGRFIRPPSGDAPPEFVTV